MTKQTQTTQAERIKALENAANVMDCYSQNGFDSVEATLHLIKTALQSKETYSPGGISKILDSIDSALYVCTDMRNCINGTAEDVGCNYSNERQSDDHRAAIQALTESGKALPRGMFNNDLSSRARDELSDISDIIFFVGDAVGNVINPEELSPRACTGVFTILMMAHDRLAALMTEGGAA